MGKISSAALTTLHFSGTAGESLSLHRGQPFATKDKDKSRCAVLWPTKELGGTMAVIAPTWMDCTITERTHLMPTESTGMTGKDITTPSRKPRWKSHRCKFRIFVLFVSKSWRKTCRGNYKWQKLKRAVLSLVLKLFKWTKNHTGQRAAQIHRFLCLSRYNLVMFWIEFWILLRHWVHITELSLIRTPTARQLIVYIIL